MSDMPSIDETPDFNEMPEINEASDDPLDNTQQEVDSYLDWEDTSPANDGTDASLMEYQADASLQDDPQVVSDAPVADDTQGFADASETNIPADQPGDANVEPDDDSGTQQPQDVPPAAEPDTTIHPHPNPEIEPTPETHPINPYGPEGRY